ncbi:NDR1/HIN1-like protein 1 [Linum perenne]
MSDQEQEQQQHQNHQFPPQEPTAHQFHFPTNHQQPTKHVSPPPPPSPSKPRVSSPGRHVVILTTIIIIFLLFLGIILLVLWLVYRPHKPRFTVAAAAVYSLNATAPPFLVAAFQFTLVTRNPNRHVSVTYDCLTTYVLYRNQAITEPVALPPIYQPTRTTVGFSPEIGGQGQCVPVSGDIVNEIATDVMYGVVPVTVVVVGKIRWKVGVLRTERYGVCVRCDVWVGLKRGSSPGQVPLLGSTQCKVDI